MLLGKYCFLNSLNTLAHLLYFTFSIEAIAQHRSPEYIVSFCFWRLIDNGVKELLFILLMNNSLFSYWVSSESQSAVIGRSYLLSLLKLSIEFILLCIYVYMYISML